VRFKGRPLQNLTSAVIPAEAGIQKYVIFLDVPPSAGLIPASLYRVKPGMTKMMVFVLLQRLLGIVLAS
jgi:hypothetical protein